MTIPFWGNDPTVLFNKAQMTELWPSADMGYEQKLNAITRLIILITILGYILTMSSRIFVIGGLTLAAIVVLFKIRKQKVTREMLDEGFSIRGNEVTGMFDKNPNSYVNPITLDTVLKSEFKESGSYASSVIKGF